MNEFEKLGYIKVKGIYIKIVEDGPVINGFYKEKNKVYYFSKPLKYVDIKVKNRACNLVKKDWFELIEKGALK